EYDPNADMVSLIGLITPPPLHRQILSAEHPALPRTVLSPASPGRRPQTRTEDPRSGSPNRKTPVSASSARCPSGSPECGCTLSRATPCAYTYQSHQSG